MVYSGCFFLLFWITSRSNMSVYVWCSMGNLPFCFGGLGNTFPISVHIVLSCYVAVRTIFLTYCLISSTCIMNIIFSLLPCGGWFVDYCHHFFVFLTSTMISLGFWSSWSIYCFRFLQKQNWSSASLFLQRSLKLRRIIPLCPRNYILMSCSAFNWKVILVRYSPW